MWSCMWKGLPYVPFIMPTCFLPKQVNSKSWICLLLWQSGTSLWYGLRKWTIVSSANQLFTQRLHINIICLFYYWGSLGMLTMLCFHSPDMLRNAPNVILQNKNKNKKNNDKYFGHIWEEKYLRWCCMKSWQLSRQIDSQRAPMKIIEPYWSWTFGLLIILI